MSALTPHIRAMRAEAAMLKVQADVLSGSLVGSVLNCMASAKGEAANQLEAEEREIEARTTGPTVKAH